MSGRSTVDIIAFGQCSILLRIDIAVLMGEYRGSETDARLDFLCAYLESAIVYFVYDDSF